MVLVSVVSVTNKKMADSKLARIYIVQLGKFVSIAFVIMLTFVAIRYYQTE